MGRVPVIDLFSGAGGLGIGATWAGADLRLSVDNDPVCCDTLRANEGILSARVLEADTTALSGRQLREQAEISSGDPLMIVGGPPCQPFSKASYWTDPGEESRYRRARAKGEAAVRPKASPEAKPDSRRDLVGEFWRLVSESDADAFVFENVPSLLHPRNRSTFEALEEAAKGAGFGTRLVRASAVEYGVPQSRSRVFLLGVKGETPAAPTPTHSRDHTGDLMRQPAVTAGDAISRYSGPEHFEPEEVVSGRWAEHLRTVPPGWNYKAHTEWGGHPSPTFVTETRFWNFLLKLSPDRPSWTIAASPGPWTGPFHWESRRLRTPELAALQAFPEGYVFTGSRRERVRQIGNAVPPLLAQRMVEQVVGCLKGSPVEMTAS